MLSPAAIMSASTSSSTTAVGGHLHLLAPEPQRYSYTTTTDDDQDDHHLRLKDRRHHAHGNMMYPRRGSLPLKKRRVLINVVTPELTYYHNDQDPSQQQQLQHHMNNPRRSSFPIFTSGSAGTTGTVSYLAAATDGILHSAAKAPPGTAVPANLSLLSSQQSSSSFCKMNALSLIAAAAAATEAPLMSSAVTDERLWHRDTPETERLQASLCPPDLDTVRQEEAGSQAMSSITVVDDRVHTGRSTASCSSTTSAFSSVSDASTSAKKTLRDNSIMSSKQRRKKQVSPTPNNNKTPTTESTRKRTPSPSSTTNNAGAIAKLSDTSVTKTMTEVSSSAAVAGSGPDKRCTGHCDEVRCSATTTRGRACAYIAVGDTKYCNLHADYDTNPPPRRKSKELGDDPIGPNVEETSPSSEETITEEQEPSDTSLLSPTSKKRALSPTNSTTDEMATQDKSKKRFRRTSAKLAEKHADSPHPLLSMIATDQWFGKIVKIALGPLEGRIGVVEKWGNGWVSVRVRGVGLHNRRSFELYISKNEREPTAADDNEDDVEEDANDSDAKTPSSLSDDRPKEVPRSVSRDAISPSPSSDSSIKSQQNRSGLPVKISRRASPLLDKRLINPRHRKQISASSPTPAHDFSPETPRPVVRGDESFDDNAETPIPSKTTFDAASKVPLPEVTPYPEKSLSQQASRHAFVLRDPTATTMEDLQLPDASSSLKTESNDPSSKLFSSSTGRFGESSAHNRTMVFRPSMGERTRGRVASHSEDDDDDYSSSSHSPHSPTLSMTVTTPSSASVVRPKKRSHAYINSDFEY